MAMPPLLNDDNFNSASEESHTEDETPTVIGLVTNPEFSIVGKPSNSGTHNSVSQSLLPVIGARLKPLPKMVPQSGDMATHHLAELGPPLALLARALVGSGSLWEDPAFPCTEESITGRGGGEGGMLENIVWSRPGELERDPALVREVESKILPSKYHGEDCRFLSPIYGLVNNNQLFSQVVNANQGFNPTTGYIGTVTFCLYVAGAWRPITIDDRLPSVDGKPAFLHSSDSQEFWAPLLEKALAKMLGSYADLFSATFSDVASYFGVVTESFNIRGPQLNGLDPFYVKERLLEAGSLNSLSGAGIFKLGGQGINRYRNGPAAALCYSIVEATEENITLRNPLALIAKDLGLTKFKEVVTYDWEQFSTFFNHVETSHLSAFPVLTQGWAMDGEIGAWSQETAGGGPHCPSFMQNPQYQVTVQGKGEPVVMLVALDQLFSTRGEAGMELHAIGFSIFTAAQGQRLATVQDGGWIADSGDYRNVKQVVGRYLVPAGSYTIIPSTFLPEKQAEFSLRVMVHREEAARVSFTGNQRLASITL